VPRLLWDASALLKRYFAEVGTDTVDALFAQTPPVPMAVTYLGYAEVAATLRRQLNAGRLNRTAFDLARVMLEREVFHTPNVALLSIDDSAILAGIPLADAHNLNASDAAILALYMRYIQSRPVEEGPALLVSADRRLLRAARGEGMQTLDPEGLPAADVQTFLARFR
jgi:predicted nucleic acid-binding protein